MIFSILTQSYQLLCYSLYFKRSYRVSQFFCSFGIKIKVLFLIIIPSGLVWSYTNLTSSQRSRKFAYFISIALLLFLLVISILVSVFDPPSIHFLIARALFFSWYSVFYLLIGGITGFHLYLFHKQKPPEYSKNSPAVRSFRRVRIFIVLFFPSIFFFFRWLVIYSSKPSLWELFLLFLPQPQFMEF